MSQIIGYLSNFALHTNFYTQLYTGIWNVNGYFPTIYSLFNKFLPEKLEKTLGKRNISTAAKYLHSIEWKKTDFHSIIMGSKTEESVVITAVKEKYEENPKEGNDMWGKFIVNADEINIYTKFNTVKTKDFSDKLFKTIALVHSFMNDKDGTFIKSIELEPYDYSPFDKLVLLQAAVQEKWKEKNIDLDTYGRVLYDLQKLFKPCCIFSLYASLLKSIYAASNNESYIKLTWQTFLKHLRFQWETQKSFPKIQLEKTRSYNSITYTNLQFLLKMEYIYKRIKAMYARLDLNPHEFNKNCEKLQAEEEEEKFYEAQSAEYGENYNYYQEHEKIVFFYL